MILPPLLGPAPEYPFYIFTACDAGYFDQFAQPLINSVATNTDCHLHLHVFNPRSDQLAYCDKLSGVTVTYEYVELEKFFVAAKRWASEPTTAIEKNHYDRTLNAMGKGNDNSILERMQKTYFACARFIRLAKIKAEYQTVFAMDIDAVVRRPLINPGQDQDFYLHRITGKKARCLAGGLYLRNTSGAQNFLRHYSEELTASIERDYVYWGLDQDILDRIVPQHRHGQLPISLIDWNMQDSSCVWTAKGTRKENSVFVNEKQKYTA